MLNNLESFIKMGIKEKLDGGDLRSIAEANKVAEEIGNQEDFDSLFLYLYDKDRLIVMRAADAIEKITLARPEYLKKHKNEIINFCLSEVNMEFKWHLALLLSRLSPSLKEQYSIFEILKKWALNTGESKIVRVNAIQSLYELAIRNEIFEVDFAGIINIVGKENIPSLNARIRKLKL